MKFNRRNFLKGLGSLSILPLALRNKSMEEILEEVVLPEELTPEDFEPATTLDPLSDPMDPEIFLSLWPATGNYSCHFGFPIWGNDS